MKTTARVRQGEFGAMVEIYKDDEHQYGVLVEAAPKLGDPKHRRLALEAIRDSGTVLYTKDPAWIGVHHDLPLPPNAWARMYLHRYRDTATFADGQSIVVEIGGGRGLHASLTLVAGQYVAAAKSFRALAALCDSAESATFPADYEATSD